MDLTEGMMVPCSKKYIKHVKIIKTTFPIKEKNKKYAKKNRTWKKNPRRK